MNSEFIDILKKLIAEKGKEVLLNNVKCKAFLADYTRGEYKKESRLLLQALDAGVQKAIDTAGELDTCKQRQIRVLHEEHFLTEEAAADVVDTLVLVLRGEQENGTSQNVVCSNCGKELQEGWTTCPYCATPVVAAVNTSQIISSAISSGSGSWGYGVGQINPAAPTAAETANPNTVKSTPGQIFISILVLILAGCGGTGVIPLILITITPDIHIAVFFVIIFLCVLCAFARWIASKLHAKTLNYYIQLPFNAFIRVTLLSRRFPGN